MVLSCLCSAVRQVLHPSGRLMNVPPGDLQANEWVRFDGFWKAKIDAADEMFCGQNDALSLLLRFHNGQVDGIGWSVGWANGKFSVTGKVFLDGSIQLHFWTTEKQKGCQLLKTQWVLGKFILDREEKDICGIAVDRNRELSSSQLLPAQSLFLVRRESNGTKYPKVDLSAPQWTMAGLRDQKAYFRIYDSEVTSVDNDEEDAGLCSICFEAPISVLILPCGHYATCYECASMLKECAFCRRPILYRVRREVDTSPSSESIVAPISEIL